MDIWTVAENQWWMPKWSCKALSTDTQGERVEVIFEIDLTLNNPMKRDESGIYWFVCSTVAACQTGLHAPACCLLWHVETHKCVLSESSTNWHLNSNYRVPVRICQVIIAGCHCKWECVHNWVTWIIEGQIHEYWNTYREPQWLKWGWSLVKCTEPKKVCPHKYTYLIIFWESLSVGGKLIQLDFQACDLATPKLWLASPQCGTVEDEDISWHGTTLCGAREAESWYFCRLGVAGRFPCTQFKVVTVTCPQQ